ncbi:MAG: adenylosuccinate synthase [Candidatus Caldarchaeum sp.]|nr:adenylosuccinate synthase [Candidatus Caldarchaeum sp.]
MTGRADIIIGLQWGDEGKGKISYILSHGAEAVVRFQGGANAGHTVVVEGRRFKFNMLPAGCLAGAKPVVAAGCVLDVEAFEREVRMLRDVGRCVEPLVSRSCQLILPIHREMDRRIEQLRGGGAIGTTLRGIGPAYADKTLRTGVRAGDIEDAEGLKNKLQFLRRLHGLEAESDVNRLREVLQPHLGDVEPYLNGIIDSGGRVVLEGAQGVLLDVDHGTYPYVTSSNTVAAAGLVSSGIPVSKAGRIVGVMKAYATRVGAGPFPTELAGSLAERIRESGGEYGTTTGRARRVGWLDIPSLKYACMLNGVSEIAVTKLDVLNGLPTLKACVRYVVDGAETDSFAEAKHRLDSVKPVYEELRGWSVEADAWVDAVRHGWDELPSSVREYLSWLEKTLDVKISIASVGEEAGMAVRRD